MDKVDKEKEIVSAKLSIYKQALDSRDTKVPGYMHVGKVLKGWDLNGYNWQLRPPGQNNFFDSKVINREAYDTTDNGLSKLGWYDFDVTDYVVGVIKGQSNNGVGITMWPYGEWGPEENIYMYPKFSSSDNNSVERRPKLEIISKKTGVNIHNEMDINTIHKQSVTFANGVMTLNTNSDLFKSDYVNVVIYSITGRAILHIKDVNLNNGISNVTLDKNIALAEGIYYVKVYNNNVGITSKLKL